MRGGPGGPPGARGGWLPGPAATGLAFAAIATAAALAAAALALPLARAVEQGLAERLALMHVAAIRDRILRHSLALPPRLVAGRRRSLVMLRFVGDMNAVRGWVRFGVARLIVLAVALPGLTLALALLDPPIALLVGVPGALAPAVLLILAPALRRRHAAMRRRRARVAAEAAEALTHAASVTAAGRAASVRRRVRRRGEALTEAGAARARLSFAVRSLPEAMILLALAAIGLAAAHGIGAGVLPAGPGGLLGAVVGLGVLAPMLADLARALDRRCDAMVAYAAIRRFLALPTLHGEGGAALADGSGPLGIMLDGVRLRPGAPVLDATIRPGAMVGVVGPTGSGKSALLACLAGLDRPHEGCIRVGEADACALEPRLRRDAIALAGPDLMPPSGSVRRALRWRAPGATEADITAVVDEVGLAPAIARAGGLDVRLGAGGWTPSHGERGLILLASALMGSPRLLLLDAPETLLSRAALGRLAALLARPGLTVVVATEDTALLARCDTILALDAPAMAAAV